MLPEPNEYLGLWVIGANSEARFVFVLFLAHRSRSIWRHFKWTVGMLLRILTAISFFSRGPDPSAAS